MISKNELVINYYAMRIISNGHNLMNTLVRYYIIPELEYLINLPVYLKCASFYIPKNIKSYEYIFVLVSDTFEMHFYKNQYPRVLIKVLYVNLIFEYTIKDINTYEIKLLNYEKVLKYILDYPDGISTALDKIDKYKDIIYFYSLIVKEIIDASE